MEEEISDITSALLFFPLNSFPSLCVLADTFSCPEGGGTKPAEGSSVINAASP